MKILITGGFGFIGARLGLHLSYNKKIKVFLGTRRDLKKPCWLKNGDVIKIDWDNQESLFNACKNIDIIVHTSGLNAKECLQDPKKAMIVNGTSTEKLVQTAIKSSISKFIYISTAHVYNSNLDGVITEKTEILNQHPYAKSHVLGENFTMHGHNKDKMQCYIIRLANAFGVPIDLNVDCWMLVINDLCKQAIEDKRLVIKGPSNNQRNFISLKDTCMAIEYLIKDNRNFSSPLICNLGDTEHTIMNIAKIIRKTFNDKTNVQLPICEVAKPNIISKKLEFRSMRLEQIGYKFSSSFSEELIKLTEFCEEKFLFKNE